MNRSDGDTFIASGLVTLSLRYDIPGSAWLVIHAPAAAPSMTDRMKIVPINCE